MFFRFSNSCRGCNASPLLQDIGDDIEKDTAQEECTVHGEGLERGTKNQECSFEVISTYNDLFYLQVHVKEGLKGEVSTEVECLKEGVYKVSYKPKTSGSITVEIMWRGKHLNGSPFKVRIDEQLEDEFS